MCYTITILKPLRKIKKRKEKKQNKKTAPQLAAEFSQEVLTQNCDPFEVFEKFNDCLDISLSGNNPTTSTFLRENSDPVLPFIGNIYPGSYHGELISEIDSFISSLRNIIAFTSENTLKDQQLSEAFAKEKILPKFKELLKKVLDDDNFLRFFSNEVRIKAILVKKKLLEKSPKMEQDKLIRYLNGIFNLRFFIPLIKEQLKQACKEDEFNRCNSIMLKTEKFLNNLIKADENHPLYEFKGIMRKQLLALSIESDDYIIQRMMLVTMYRNLLNEYIEISQTSGYDSIGRIGHIANSKKLDKKTYPSDEDLHRLIGHINEIIQRLEEKCETQEKLIGTPSKFFKKAFATLGRQSGDERERSFNNIDSKEVNLNKPYRREIENLQKLIAKILQFREVLFNNYAQLAYITLNKLSADNLKLAKLLQALGEHFPNKNADFNQHIGLLFLAITVDTETQKVTKGVLQSINSDYLTFIKMLKGYLLALTESDFDPIIIKTQPLTKIPYCGLLEHGKSLEKFSSNFYINILRKEIKPEIKEHTSLIQAFEDCLENISEYKVHQQQKSPPASIDNTSKLTRTRSKRVDSTDNPPTTWSTPKGQRKKNASTPTFTLGRKSQREEKRHGNQGTHVITEKENDDEKDPQSLNKLGNLNN